MDTQTFYTALGERLRSLRLAWGISQQELAKRLGVTFQQVQKYERGINRISLDLACRLSRIFGVPLDYWCTGRIAPVRRQRAPRQKPGLSLPGDLAMAGGKGFHQSIPEILPEAIRQAMEQIPSPAVRALLEAFSALVLPAGDSEEKEEE